MKKIVVIIIVLLSCASLARAQAVVKYFEYVGHAKSSFDRKEYKKSAAHYASAFKLNGGKAYSEDRYNAARSWTLAGNKDSAFVQLFKVATLYDYSNYKELTTEKDFKNLYTDKRWTELTNVLKENISRSDSKLNSALVLLLDSVYREHYSHRMTEVSIKKVHGTESPEILQIKKTIREKDSVNLAIVVSVLDRYGWLGKDVAGFIGNYTLALVIQHADLKIQETYLAMVQEAFKNKNIEAYDFALIEDKVALRQGKKQVYGSVIINRGNKHYVAPVEDVENLNKRRLSLGLKPMNEYLMNWGMSWDINKYKKDLLLLEKEQIEY